MKKTIIILIFFACVAMQAKATECSSRTFQEEKINLYFCQNYSAYQETRALLFKARAKVLNDYIIDKIAKGELADKKFEIQIYDRILSFPCLELTQGKNGYFITLGGSLYPSLQELKAFVDYFAKTDWKPFLSGNYDDVGSDVIYKRIDNFYKRNIKDDTIACQPFAVWEKDGVSLQYSGDSLRYIINDTPLPFQANSNLPVKIRDRYLFFQENKIFVVQDMRTIKTLKLEELSYDDFGVFVHSKWVNICWGHSEQNCIYSYSYDKNRFYKNEQ